MESNLSDISLVSPSVAAAAVAAGTNQWSRMPNTFTARNGNAPARDSTTLKYSPGLASATERSSLFAGLTFNRGSPSNDADKSDDDASNASTMQLLDIRPNTNTSALDSDITGLADEVAKQTNARYAHIMKNKSGNANYNMETESVRTEDFVNKFQLISVSNDTTNRKFQNDRPSRLLLNDTTSRVNTSAQPSALFSRLASQAQPSAASTSTSNRNSIGASNSATNRLSPFRAKPLESLIRPTLLNGTAPSTSKLTNSFTSALNGESAVGDIPLAESSSTTRLKPTLTSDAAPSSHKAATSSGVSGSAKSSTYSFGSPSNSEVAARTSPLRSSTMERLNTKLTELEELNKEVRSLRNEKQRIVDEVERMNQLLKQQQLDIRNFDMFRATSRTKADGLRNELTSMQQKRDATLREIDQLNSDLASRRGKLTELEESASKRMQEIRQFESLGVTKQEIDALVAQRNELIELVSQLETRENEKYQVQKQLEQTHSDRIKDQRAFQEKFSQISSQLEQVLRENATLKGEISRLHDEAATLKRDRDAFLEHAAAQYKQRVQREVSEVQKQATNEIASLKAELYDVNEKSKQFQRELERKNNSLQTMQLEKQRMQEQVERYGASDTEEISRFYENMQRQNDEALRTMQMRMMEDRQAELRSHEANFASELEQFRQALLEKDKECMVLRDKLRYVQSTCEQLSSRFSRENLRNSAAQTGAMDDMVNDALEQERRKWKEEQDQALRTAQNELVNCRQERDKVIKSLDEELERVNKKLEDYDRLLRSARDELDKERQARNQLAAERIRELTKVKEDCRQTIQNELEKIQACAVQEAQNESNRYKAQATELQKKLDDKTARENEFARALQNMVKPILIELNLEFGEIASILEVEPRSFEIARFTSADLESTREALHTSLVASKGAFSRARSALQTYNNDVTLLKQLLEDYERRKIVEIDQIRSQLAADSERKLEELREKLQSNRDNGRQSQSSPLKSGDGDLATRELQSKWKQETAKRIANQLQGEFRNQMEQRTGELQQALRERDAQIKQLREEKSELEQRLQSQKAVVDETATKTITQLHGQLKQLRDENLELHKAASLSRKISASQPNLYEESDQGSVSKGVTFARRPGSPIKSALTLERTGSLERRNDPTSINHVRFSNSSAAFTSATASNASDPLNRSLPSSTTSYTPAALPFSAPSSPQFTRSNLFANASRQSAPATAPLSNTLSTPIASRDYQSTFSPEQNGMAEDLQAQVYEAAKNKTLRQIDRDYSNLKAKLQRSTPNFRPANGAAPLNGSPIISSTSRFNGGNTNGSAPQRGSPLARPLNRTSSKMPDVGNKLTYYETAM